MITLASTKELRLLLLWGIPILAVVVAPLWKFQQNNVDSLATQIGALQQQIDALPATVAPKDKLALEKDRLTLEKDRVNAQNAIVGSVVQALGAGFFFISAYFTWRSLKVAEENLRATQKKQETERSIAEANLKATEEKQVTERFSKAVELLGNEKLEVRLGGIYALERIAKDSPKDHWTIMEVLSSFIQTRSPQNSEKEQLQKIAMDVQATLTVIGRRHFNKDPEDQKLNLSFTNLAKAYLPRANLAKADFTGADLRRADLRSADLREASFTMANLINTKFDGAKLNGATFFFAVFGKSLLEGTNFTKAQGLDPNQIQAARGWGSAIYDEDFHKELGLPPKFEAEKQED